jgi:hypothetical protein
LFFTLNVHWLIRGRGQALRSPVFPEVIAPWADTIPKKLALTCISFHLSPRSPRFPKLCTSDDWGPAAL